MKKKVGKGSGGNSKKMSDIKALEIYSGMIRISSADRKYLKIL